MWEKAQLDNSGFYSGRRLQAVAPPALPPSAPPPTLPPPYLPPALPPANPLPPGVIPRGHCGGGSRTSCLYGEVCARPVQPDEAIPLPVTWIAMNHSDDCYIDDPPHNTRCRCKPNHLFQSSASDEHIPCIAQNSGLMYTSETVFYQATGATRTVMRGSHCGATLNTFVSGTSAAPSIAYGMSVTVPIQCPRGTVCAGLQATMTPSMTSLVFRVHHHRTRTLLQRPRVVVERSACLTCSHCRQEACAFPRRSRRTPKPPSVLSATTPITLDLKVVSQAERPTHRFLPSPSHHLHRLRSPLRRQFRWNAPSDTASCMPVHCRLQTHRHRHPGTVTTGISRAPTEATVSSRVATFPTATERTSAVATTAASQITPPSRPPHPPTPPPPPSPPPEPPSPPPPPPPPPPVPSMPPIGTDEQSRLIYFDLTDITQKFRDTDAYSVNDFYAWQPSSVRVLPNVQGFDDSLYYESVWFGRSPCWDSTMFNYKPSPNPDGFKSYREAQIHAEWKANA